MRGLLVNFRVISCTLNYPLNSAVRRTDKAQYGFVVGLLCARKKRREQEFLFVVFAHTYKSYEENNYNSSWKI